MKCRGGKRKEKERWYGLNLGQKNFNMLCCERNRREVEEKQIEFKFMK